MRASRSRSRVLAACAAIAFVGVVVACSSSNNSSNSTAGVPSCQGASASTGPGSTACNSCLQTSCGSQIGAVQSGCGAYVACYDGCQCSDLNCISGCLGKIDSTCQNSYGPLVSCLSQSCATPCGTSSPKDGGGD
jgi:hypothetical protein